MTILEQNIVFLKSQVMDDVPEGGGAPTRYTVVDGAMNNVYPDISDVDRAYGRLRLRKLTLAVRSLLADLFGGVKTVVSGLSEDSALGYLLFKATDSYEQRAAAADRLAAYLYKGPLYHGALNENHIAGMRAISVIQRVNTPLPVIGQTLCLVQNEGLSTEQEQYVRVTRVTPLEMTFSDSAGDYTRWIVTLALSAALRYDFAGHTVNHYDTYNYTGKTRIRITTVADATSFYGTQRLAVAASIGDLKVKAASLYAQLVPNAQTETPLVSQTLSGQKTPMLASRSSAISYTVTGTNIGPGGKFVLDTGAMPGSIALTAGGLIITDDGTGNALHGTTVVGAWSYPNGECDFNSACPTVPDTYPVVVAYIPAASVAQQAHTAARPVTAETRRETWADMLLPIPAPGTYGLSYQANGVWYDLSDDGAGGIRGSDPSYGAGTLNYVNGARLVTLGALPDVGSQIIESWASPVHTTIRVGNGNLDLSLVVTGTVGEAIQPGSMIFTFLVTGVEKTGPVATSGEISGDCGGYVVHSTGDYRLVFTVPPDAGSKIGLDYERVTQATKTFTGVTVAGGFATLALGEAVKPGSIALAWSLQSVEKYDGNTVVIVLKPYAPQCVITSITTSSGVTRRYEVTATDDGAGHIADLTGTANYGTGDLVVPLLPAITESTYSQTVGSWGSTSTSANVSFVSGIVQATYTPDSATPVTVSTEIDLPPLILRVIPRLVDESLVSGGLRFAWNGHTYVERAGVLYRDISPATGSGTVAGSVNLLSGDCTLTDYVSGTGAVTISALLTRFGAWSAISACFRTAAAPIKPQALSFVATTEDGEQITGEADADGNIAGTWMRGSADYQFGTGAVEFGQLVASVWTPRAVDPSTIRYNAVAYSYLPLDAGILGVDPVRLPTDGRVPIYRPADLVLVMHASTNAPATPTLGTYTYTDDGGNTLSTSRYLLSCGRTRVAWVRIADANGATVLLQTSDGADGKRGTGLDRAQGLIYWESLTGLATPLTVTHTIADLRMVQDAQISGWITLDRALSHSFPANESLVASCLLQGDLRARVGTVFDQQTWDGATWADAPTGTAATATLDTVNYPITVSNAGADNERWAFRCANATTNQWSLTGEHHGLVWSGTYAPYVSGTPVDVAPINPRTLDENGENGVPYLTIPQRANGGGWSTGNTVFFKTIGGLADFWIANSIQPSDEPSGSGADGCEIHALGNVDRP